jgi:hypothetical protein
MGLAVTWTLAAGATFQTTAETWATGNFLATANQVNTVGIIGAFKIAIPNLIKGQNYNDWISKGFSREMSEAFLSYETTYPFGVAPATPNKNLEAPYLRAISTTDFYTNRIDFIKKRRVPTLSFYNPFSGAANSFYSTAGATAGTCAIQLSLLSDDKIHVYSSTAGLASPQFHGIHVVFDSRIYL